MSLPGSACRCRPAVRQSCTYPRLPPRPTTESGDGEGRRPPRRAALRARRLPWARRGGEGGREGGAAGCRRAAAPGGAFAGRRKGLAPGAAGWLPSRERRSRGAGEGGGRPSREVVVEIKGRRGGGW